MSLFQLSQNGALAQLVEALDKNPAALNEPQKGGLFDGRTLLMCAAAKGQIEVVKELLKRGADASIADKRGATAEALARKQNHEAVATLIATPSLHEAGSPTLHKELGFNDHNYWAAPLPAPAPAPAAPPPPAPGKKRSASDADDDNSKRARPANATPPRDGPSLAQAAQLGNLSAVCTLLDLNPSALNTPIVGGLFDGRTLLMCAASRGHKDLVVELIKRGADLSATDKRGATAESLARKQNQVEVADLLLASGSGSGGGASSMVAESSIPSSSAVAAASSSNKRSRDEEPVEEPSAAKRIQPAPAPAPAPTTTTSSSASSMTVKVQTKGGFELGGGSGLFAGGTLVEVVADAEATSLSSVLDALGQRYGIVLTQPVDAKGRTVEPTSDVFTAWLEHGDGPESGFDSDLVLKCTAAPVTTPDTDAVAAALAEGTAEAEEAASIYDILGE